MATEDAGVDRDAEGPVRDKPIRSSRLPLARLMRGITRRQFLAGSLLGGGVAAIGGAVGAMLAGRELQYYLPPSIGSLGGAGRRLELCQQQAHSDARKSRA